MATLDSSLFDPYYETDTAEGSPGFFYGPSYQGVVNGVTANIEIRYYTTNNAWATTDQTFGAGLNFQYAVNHGNNNYDDIWPFFSTNLTGGSAKDTITGIDQSAIQAQVEAVSSDPNNARIPNEVFTVLAQNDTSLAELAQSDYLNGAAGDDTLIAGPGNDILVGGPGDDTLIAGSGIDVCGFSDTKDSYKITFQNGAITVTDLRDGSPDGTDTIKTTSDWSKVYFNFGGTIYSYSELFTRPIIDPATSPKTIITDFSRGERLEIKDSSAIGLTLSTFDGFTSSNKLIAKYLADTALLYLGNTLVETLVFEGNSVDARNLVSIKQTGGDTFVEVDPVPVGPEDPQTTGPLDPSENKIQWSIIHANESVGGVSVLSPYVPNASNPKDSSGATVAQGVDLGQAAWFTQTFGTSNWTNQPNLVYLNSLSLENHQAAINSIKTDNPVPQDPNRPQTGAGNNPYSANVSLSYEQVNALTYNAEYQTLNQLIKDYNAAAQSGAGWDTLSSGQQTAIFDIAYNLGLHKPKVQPPAKQHYGLEDLASLWTYLVTHDWQDASLQILYRIGQSPSRRAQNARLILDGTTFSPPGFNAPQPVNYNNVQFSLDILNKQSWQVEDPHGPILTITEASGSPLIAQIALPADFAASYLISEHTNGVWSSPVTAQADDILSFGSQGVDGLRVVMLDDVGKVVNGSPDFPFILQFENGGHVSASVVSLASAASPITSDFNADGQSDILWRNVDGSVAIWNTGANSDDYVSFDPGYVSDDWRIAGTGDFNGAGPDGVLWRNANGDVTTWNASSGEDFGDNAGATISVSTDWQIAGVGDFNGDGLSDVLWRNANGGVDIWFANLDSASVSFAAQPVMYVSDDWQIQKVGDFNGAGRSGVLWRNANTGDVTIWSANAASGGFDSADLGAVSSDWSTVGAGDFDGNGQEDILWRNANGEVALWTPNATATGYQSADLGFVSTDWQIEDVGDYTGDGRSDILWQNANSNHVAIWRSDDNMTFTSVDLGPVSTDWRVAQV